MPRPIAAKKQADKAGAVDEDSAEEVIIVGSPQQQPLTEQNVLQLMAKKCKEFPAQNLLKSSPSSGYVLHSEKKNEDTANANAATDEWSDEEDEDEEDENNDEKLKNAPAGVRRTGRFNRAGLIDISQMNSFQTWTSLAEPTSSNDEEDEDESEPETHMIPREVLMVRIDRSRDFAARICSFSNIANAFNAVHRRMKKNPMMMKQ